MYTLGINAAYHDPAACLVQDGQVIAAVEEERFTRIKHGKRPIAFSAYELPFHAIDYCLKEAGIRLVDVDHIAYSFDPWLLLGDHRGDERIELPLDPSAHPTPEEWEAGWDPLFLSSIVNAPRHVVGGVPHWLRARFRGAEWNGPFRWHFVEHHVAHEASAFYAAPFEDAAILTLDGRGERATTTYALGRDGRMERIGQVNMPHSLGHLYERITDYLGFLHSSDEGKVMALASYGEPTYVEDFRDIVRVGRAGQFTVEAVDFEDLFGPRRHKGEPLEPRHADVAHSLQAVLEETALQLAGWLHGETGARNLCAAGGVALNCVMNARIRDEGPFENVWVQPAPGDAGTALGAALWIDHEIRRNGNPQASNHTYPMDHAFLGPSYSDEEIEALLQRSKQSYRRLEDIPGEAADVLARNRIIGWFQGRLEFGPRALGARSILASPMDAAMKDRLNDIKGREDFRPVAPVVLEEETANWFGSPTLSPFMLFVHDIRPEKEALIPAASHVDGTARIQTINRGQHALYYDLIKAFQARTGVPVLINTSFNTHSEPIVCTPRDALETFWSSPLDALVIGSFMIEKPE
jgi:carbamoyltransferase